MAATIKDIAKKLHYSTSTVSYALNGGPRSVPDHVKENVFAVARELGYRPNRIAKSLVTRTSRTIGLVLERPTHDVFLAPYLNAVFNAVMNVAEDRQYDVLIFSQHKSSTVTEFTNQLLDGRVDGIILIAGTVLQQIAKDVHAYGLPVTTLFMPQIPGIPRLLANNAMGIRQAMAHLVERGHKKIGFLSGPVTLVDSIERRDSFHASVVEFGCEWNSSWEFCGEFSQPGGYEAALHILSQPNRPTALCSANDEMAAGAYLAAKSLGLRIPHDLSIVGFDDTAQAEFLHPPLTTIRQPMADIGREAAEHLIAIIEGHSVAQTTLFHTSLVVRQSTTNPTKDSTHEISHPSIYAH